jgi:hypothetical protein
MIIETWTVRNKDAMPVSVIAVLTRGGVGQKKIPVSPCDDLYDLQCDAARELANRPALRLIEQTEERCIFEA